MSRCTERSPINDWQCSRNAGHYAPTHLARDPKAPPLKAQGCIVVEGAAMVAAEEWATIGGEA